MKDFDFDFSNINHRRGLHTGEAMSDVFVLTMYDRHAAWIALNTFRQYGAGLEPGSREARAFLLMEQALELLHDEACSDMNGNPTGAEIHKEDEA